MADVLERDAGFCSGGDEDDMEAEDGIHSPTDASEDSVDVKVQPISLRNRNKRKCAEPRKLDTDLPAKKRKLDLTITKGEVQQSGRSPFRPWSASPPSDHRDESPLRFSVVDRVVLPLKSDASGRTVDSTLARALPEFNVISVPRLPSPQCHPPFVQQSHDVLLPKFYPIYLPLSYSPDHQEEPLSLVSKRKSSESEDSEKLPNHVNSSPRLLHSEGKSDVQDVQDVRTEWRVGPKDFFSAKVPSLGVNANDRGSYVTNKLKLNGCSKTNGEKKVKTKPEDGPHLSDNKFRIDSLLSSVRTEGSSVASTSKSSQGGGQQRNYKNMTRERRIEANARERTRVHTISAAFDTLRHSIPAYSHNQKLSKLSVLRIACSYITTLSRLAGYDYSKDQTEPDLSTCIDNVSRTIQTEGKIRKKKED